MGKSGYFRASTAMLNLAQAFAGLSAPLKAFGAAARDLIKRRDYEPRIKGKNRRRRHRGGVSHTMSRFARKTQQYGGEYRPGKLFKGHRI